MAKLESGNPLERENIKVSSNGIFFVSYLFTGEKLFPFDFPPYKFECKYFCHSFLPDQQISARWQFNFCRIDLVVKFSVLISLCLEPFPSLPHDFIYITKYNFFTFLCAKFFFLLSTALFFISCCSSIQLPSMFNELKWEIFIAQCFPS